jgi:hypothetical protein
VSSAVFVVFIEHLWSTYPGTWKEILDWFLQNDPRRLFHLVVMPIAVGGLGIVAAGYIARDLWFAHGRRSRRL